MLIIDLNVNNLSGLCKVLVKGRTWTQLLRWMKLEWASVCLSLMH